MYSDTNFVLLLHAKMQMFLQSRLRKGGVCISVCQWGGGGGGGWRDTNSNLVKGAFLL